MAQDARVEEIYLSRVGPRCPPRKSLSVRAAERLQAARRCNRAASCRYATSGTAPYDGIACPAYARMQLRLPVRVAEAPKTDPCRDSNGSGLPAYDALRYLKSAPSTTSMDDQRERRVDRKPEISPAPGVWLA